MLAVRAEEDAAAEPAQVAVEVNPPAGDAEGGEKDRVAAAESEQEVQLVINCTLLSIPCLRQTCNTCLHSVY